MNKSLFIAISETSEENVYAIGAFSDEEKAKEWALEYGARRLIFDGMMLSTNSVNHWFFEVPVDPEGDDVLLLDCSNKGDE